MQTDRQPLILHDYFGIRGGGERLNLTLARALGAHLAYGYRTAESYDAEMFPVESTELGLPALFRRPGLRAPALALRFAAARRFAAGFDTRIFSGVASPFAAPDKAQGRNIFYCHTPPRFLYDQKARYAGRGSPARRAIENVLLGQFRTHYEAAVQRMDTVIANSETVQDRIRTYLGVDSIVVYPPCDTVSNVWLGQQPYYLSTARLSGLKRVDRIVRAFMELPDKQLVVASQGEDYDALRRLAADAPNIVFRGWVGDDELRQLIGNAIATLYVPVDEDFGMSPVESMSAGKPVIGVAEGGLRETIVHDETGFLLPSGFTDEDLIDAIQSMTPARALEMRAACEARAKLFSESRFIDSMRAIVAG